MLFSSCHLLPCSCGTPVPMPVMTWWSPCASPVAWTSVCVSSCEKSSSHWDRTHLKDLTVACLHPRTPNFRRVPFTGTVAKLRLSIASQGHTRSLNTIHGKTMLPLTVIALVPGGWETLSWEFKTEGIQWRELTAGGRRREKVQQRTLNRPNRSKSRKVMLCALSTLEGQSEE